jgi:ribose transport system substrate-binding protein
MHRTRVAHGSAHGRALGIEPRVRSRPIVAALAGLALVGAMGACRREPTPNTSTGLHIAVVPKGTTHVFWQMIHAGVRKAEVELDAAGTDVTIDWQGPLREDETQDQINLVSALVSRRVQGIALAALDKTALVPTVRDVQKAGIPVVIFDSGLDGEPGKDYVAYVATNNYQGGALAARRLGEVVGTTGKVILLRYMVGSESTMQREQGFLDTLTKEFPEIDLISSDQYAGATEEQAFQKSQSILARFDDDANGIFCPNESSTAGMLGALDQAGLAGKVKLVGFDASEKLVAALRGKKIHGLVLQNPMLMGYTATMTLVRHIRKEPIETLVDTGVVVLTPENVEEPAMIELHSPDLSRWLGAQ